MSEQAVCARCGVRLGDGESRFCSACLDILRDEGHEIDRQQVELLRRELARRRLDIDRRDR
jgi:hypothetical protein